MATDDKTQSLPADESQLRERALTRLKRRRDFRIHLLIYVLVNLFLVVIWWVTNGTGSFFWPIFPIMGWGIGLVGHGYDVYLGQGFTETQIREEMEKLHRRG